MILLDFETRSRVDLKRHGSHTYARDPSTEVLCCSFLHESRNQPWTWRNPTVFPHADADLPDWVFNHLTSDCQVAAHNATFDRLIWEYVFEPDFDMPPIDFDRWYCTSAMCRVNALPGKLEDAIRAVTSDMRKDHRGASLIRALSIPQDNGTFNEDPELLEEMVEYCEQDIRVTSRLVQECRALMPHELRDWQINERTNERGICIDVDLAASAIQYAQAEQTAIAAELTRVTNGIITKHTQTQRIRTWVRQHLELADITTTPMVRYKGGEKRYSIDKAARAELLGRASELDIPEHVIDVIELTDDGNRSSVAKFQKMLDQADPEDHRVRNALVYAGAQATLRKSSRGAQAHNMRRDCWSAEETEALKARMARGEPLEDVMNTLSKLLRPTIIPAPRHKLVVGDWSSIEGMGLPWLADSPGAERVLEIFRRDEDIYLHTCKTIRIDDRQIGKVATLSLGYGGAVGAFSAMGRNYGVHLDPSQVKVIVNRWRHNNAWAVEFWAALERAAKRAIREPGTEHHAGRVSYLFVPELLGGTLLCLLPGELVIQYPKARLERLDDRQGVSITALKASWTAKADATEWPRHVLWHGLLAENATQALCGGILRHALAELDDDGYSVLDVHDEIVLEVPEAEVYAARDRLTEVQNTPPSYAADLPLRAKPAILDRYGKAP